MDTKQIRATLDRVFNEEKARIVFWNDPEKEFLTLFQGQLFSPIDGVEVIQLDQISALEAKIKIERDDPEGRYLLYTPSEEPEYEDDWLLDVRLYSRSFRADRASIILDELGLTHQSLRSYLSKRRKFFDNKERVQKLKQLVEADDNELDLDRKMLAVVTKTDQSELFNIVRALFHAIAEADEIDLEVVPPAWDQIEKFELDEPFWGMVKTQFGYEEETPNLRNLLIRLMLADYAHRLDDDLPTSLQQLQLSRSGTHNAVVCLAQWRDSGSKGRSYDLLAAEASAILHIPDILRGIEMEKLLEVTTFLDVEKAIVKGLLERVTSTAETIDAASIRAIATRRQAGHWVSSISVPESHRKARHAVYEALAVAAEFFDLRNRHHDGFHFDDAAAMYRGYEEELYKFDQMYRLFCEHAAVAGAQGWDVLKPLREEVEACYCNWYLTQISLAWGKFVSSGLLDEWQIDQIPNEYLFFRKRVKPHLDKGEKRRAFVVISDAFRYEIAQELTHLLNGKYRFKAELSSQLSVLPSYTALGMASLLPHGKLEYTQKGDVLVDGKPTASLEHRNDILGGVAGIAVKADRLVDMKKEEGRAFISGKRVVYIYHDEIDSRGEKASTERDTFEACRKTVCELADLVNYIINNLNGNHVLLTADHGFLFTETAPDEADKSKLTDKPSGTVKAKKRYLLGHNLPDYDDAWRGKTSVTAHAEGDMEFWIPKGANRFHFTGGARFIHGGAMLQEVVVPVITVKHMKSKQSREKTATKYVTVQVLGAKHKITAQKHRFTLIQMEPVSERSKAITLKVAVYEGAEAVTSIESVTFDSKSGSLDDRQKQVIFTLQDRQYDKKTPYRLVLRDADTGIEQQSVDVIIDRAISDDFDF